MHKENYYAVIMAGGVGSRFWPSSRTNYPKQFIDILGTGNTLIQQTYKRFLKQFLPENIYIVTNAAYVGLVNEQLPDVGSQQILAEPMGKNTAACIAYACGKITKINKNAVCIIAPSDHLILDESSFLSTVNLGMLFAQENHALITLGIKPSRPDTGYGYIQYLHQTNQAPLHKVKTFTEKPNLELAQTFINSGDFLWNAGIFIWSVNAIKQAFDEHLHDQLALFTDASAAYYTDKEAETIKTIYEQTRNISIDVGIMEKAQNVFVIPSDFGWSDLGTWNSLYDIMDKDDHANATKGKNILCYHATGNMIDAQAKGNKLIVLNSVQNLIVIDTPDVLLICDRNKEQEVKQVATDVKIKFNEKYS